MPKFFISHAVRDKKLIDSFIDLLQSGMNIDYNDIYCTSQGVLKNGELFIDDIRVNLIHSEVVILLLSNNFFASKFCLNEMGATWALGKPFIPIIVPPCDFKKLEDTAIKGVQASRIHIKNDMIHIFEELVKRGILSNVPYARFDAKLTDFIRKKPWEAPGLGSLLY